MRSRFVFVICLLAARALVAGAPDTLFVEVERGVRLEVLDWGGRGPEVVLLAGQGNTAHVFDDFARYLVRHARVRGVTRRGYGASTHAINGYDQRNLARDVKVVCDSLEIARPVLVGHSLSGSEMAWFEQQWPDRARALVFLDAAYDHSRLGELEEVAPQPTSLTPTQGDKSSPEAVRTWLLRTRGCVLPMSEITALFCFGTDGRMMDSTTSSTAAGLIRYALSPPPFARVRAPTLAIYAMPTLASRYPAYGSFDAENQALARARVKMKRAWTESEMSAFQQAVPHAVIVVCDGANHHLHLTEGAGTALAVGAFLETLDQ